MATIRVTQGILVQRALTNLRDQSRDILELQTRLATGRRINTPSDDPLGARLAINVRTRIGENEQFIRNIQNVSPRLQETATSVESLVDVFQRVRELSIQGANGSNEQLQLNAIAEEVNELLEVTFSIGNQRQDNRSIFSGTNTRLDPFAATRGADGEITAVNYVGNNERITVRISENATAITNETGGDVFLRDQDVYATLINLRDALRSGDQTFVQDNTLAELDVIDEQLLASLARVGATQNRLDRVADNTDDFNFELEALQSDVLDADFAETITQLNAQSNAFEAALSATARTIQPSLLNFLQ